MSLDKALAAAQSEIPECVATGYVDMVSGLLLGVKTVDSQPGSRRGVHCTHLDQHRHGAGQIAGREDCASSAN